MNYKDYPIQAYDKVRYSDADPQGHVNNAVFSTYFETGRVEFLYDKDNPMCKDGCQFVIASLNANLLSEIKWPGTVEIGSGIKKIGTSSIIIIQSLFQNEKLCAVAETVVVQMDDTTRKSSPLSKETRERLVKKMI